MANVIDSLKRLERIGSEHSETTKKIIEAAYELSSKINSIYSDYDGDNDQIVNWERKDNHGHFVERIRYSLKTFHGARHLFNDNLESYVSENREAALAFAKHIADGLLEQIEADLQKRLVANKQALESLKIASESLQEKR